MPVNANPGWNAGARSIRWSDAGCEATVTPVEGVVGVFTGLSAATDVTSLTEQTHSFYFRHTPVGSFADVYERGVLKSALGTYVTGDSFKIRRATNGEVTFYKNGTLAYTSANTSTGRVFLTSAMYLAGDQI